MEYRFLSITDISKILYVSRQTVFNWLKKGYIEYSMVGILLKVRPKDLIKYLESLGNSKTAMTNFEKNIRNYLERK